MNNEKDLTLDRLEDICNAMKESYQNRYNTEYLFSQCLVNLREFITDETQYQKVVDIFNTIRDIEIDGVLKRESDDCDKFLTLYYRLLKKDKDAYIGSIYKQKDKTEYLVCLYEKRDKMVLLEFALNANNELYLNTTRECHYSRATISTEYDFVSSYIEFKNNKSIRKNIALNIRKTKLEEELLFVKEELEDCNKNENKSNR